MTSPTAPAKDAASQSFRWLRPSKILIITLIVSTLSCFLAVWVVISGQRNAYGVQSDVITSIIGINLLLLLTLCALVGRRVLSLRRMLRSEAMGSRLQRRMVRIFAVVAITPTIIIAVFSAVFFHVGIKSWFDERVQTAIDRSVEVAEAYLQEHQETIRADAIAMQGDLQRDYALLAESSAHLGQMLNAQVALRNLTEAIIFDENRVIARSDLSLSLMFERLPHDVMRQAEEGKVVLFADEDDKIQALIQLQPLTGRFLLISRLVDPRVLNHMVGAQSAAKAYRKLQADISGIQWQFSILFVVVVLLMLLASVWYGIYTAMRLVVPISRLIAAAEKVRAGDFSAQVPVGSKQDEISALGRTFNRMTSQLQKQREELMNANRQIDKRRRFTEAVFAGVSAGVVALDHQRVITLNNRVAAQLLQDDETQSMKGMPIVALLPDMQALLEEALKKPDAICEKQFTVLRKEKKRNLLVRVSAEIKEGHVDGYVVTFDDITALVSAQRQAAWSDVARRIAHEIKNPLTPIALSTERLKRKYLSQLDSDDDREAFTRYVDTINRHVGDIRDIVEEFVSFARMPSPERSVQDLRQTLREAVFSAQTAYGDVAHRLQLPEQPVMMAYDARQMAQALGNILKNAAEALHEKRESRDHFDAEIRISLHQTASEIEIILEDNGNGFPPDLLGKLTEPYVTTKAKGTGLGLAIVRKQVEDHKGLMHMENMSSGGVVLGACIRLTFPQQLPTI